MTLIHCTIILVEKGLYSSAREKILLWIVLQRSLLLVKCFVESMIAHLNFVEDGHL